MALKAVLWDFDGTLVETHKAWREAEYKFLNQHGILWSDADSQRLIGGNIELASKIIEDVSGVRFDTGYLKEGLTQYVESSLRIAVDWNPGVRELLRQIYDSSAAAGIVTSSYLPLVEIALSSLPFDPFRAIVSREDVVHPKPDPEPYLLALSRLRVPAASTIVIEDSEPGAKSALAAGCNVLVVGSLSQFRFCDPRLKFVDSLHGLSLSDLEGVFFTSGGG